MTILGAHGIEIDVLEGWEGRIFRRGVIARGEHAQPVVHLANFSLPHERGDFGSGVVEGMRGRDVFVVLFEYGRESVGKPLFAHHGMPQLTPRNFSSQRLQRHLRGQAGCQMFFTQGRRPFCLYVVVQDGRLRASLVAETNEALARVKVVGK